jgi:hypothetical protein
MSNVGIDVSKHHLDVAIRPAAERFRVENSEAGLTELLKRLRRINALASSLNRREGTSSSSYAALRKRSFPSW